MQKIYYLVLSCWLITNCCNVSAECKFDPNKDLDFCSKKCGKFVHVACDCSAKDGCYVPAPELLDDIMTFRQHCLTVHNKLRNEIATGQDAMAGTMTGKAANMNILSYDVGLEFTAGCNVKKCKMKHDHCSITKNFHTSVGQNLYTSSGGPVRPILDIVAGGVQNWFDEEKDLSNPDIIDKFLSSNENKGTIGHFTALVWATVTHVGCMVARKDEGNKIFLACNYASVFKDPPNMLHAPVYKRGEPATKCLEGREQNTEYDGLCGEQEPIPTCADASRLGVGRLYIMVVSTFVGMLLMGAM